VPLPGIDYGTFTCRYCGGEFPCVNAGQFTCSAKPCRLARKRAAEAQRRRRRARGRQCDQCGAPLYLTRVRYHPACFAQKERERLRIYYLRKRKKRRG
jgi:hypothetical protein